MRAERMRMLMINRKALHLLETQVPLVVRRCQVELHQVQPIYDHLLQKKILTPEIL